MVSQANLTHLSSLFNFSSRPSNFVLQHVLWSASQYRNASRRFREREPVCEDVHRPARTHKATHLTLMSKRGNIEIYAELFNFYYFLQRLIIEPHTKKSSWIYDWRPHFIILSLTPFIVACYITENSIRILINYLNQQNHFYCCSMQKTIAMCM